MKFYEVMSQIVLTSHLVGFDLLTVVEEDLGRAWRAEQQATLPGGGRRGDRLERGRST